MKLRSIVLTTIFSLVCLKAVAQEPGRDARRLAELNENGTPSDFVDICSGREGAIWCGAYYSGIVSALDIANDQDCFIMIDVARFLHESIWHTTSTWLYRQPESLMITYYEAVYRSLIERKGCDI